MFIPYQKKEVVLLLQFCREHVCSGDYLLGLFEWLKLSCL